MNGREGRQKKINKIIERKWTVEKECKKYKTKQFELYERNKKGAKWMIERKADKEINGMVAKKCKKKKKRKKMSWRNEKEKNQNE